MPTITRATTPTIEFVVPSSSANFTENDNFEITLAQNNKVIISLSKAEGRVGVDFGPTEALYDPHVYTTLTQAETLKLDSDLMVELQLRIRRNTQSAPAYATKVFSCDVGRILNEEVL